MKELLKTKTFWGGIGAIVTAAAGFFTGDLYPAEAIQTAVSGLLAIFIRDAIAKK